MLEKGIAFVKHCRGVYRFAFRRTQSFNLPPWSAAFLHTSDCHKMPVCQVFTNVMNDAIPDDFEVKLSELVAKVLSKPIERITVSVQPGMKMARAGTTNPTILIHIWSIAVFNAEKNPEYAAKLGPFISDTLGIEKDRIVLLFHDISADQVPKFE